MPSRLLNLLITGGGGRKRDWDAGTWCTHRHTEINHQRGRRQNVKADNEGTVGMWSNPETPLETCWPWAWELDRAELEKSAEQRTLQPHMEAEVPSCLLWGERGFQGQRRSVPQTSLRISWQRLKGLHHHHPSCVMSHPPPAPPLALTLCVRAWSSPGVERREGVCVMYLRSHCSLFLPVLP